MRGLVAVRVVAGLMLLSLACAQRRNESRPHILFILVDDLGNNDVSWAEYSDVPTPNLDSLRKESLELTQLYSQPKCTASRAALMTARYPYKMGLQTKLVFSRSKDNRLNPKYKLLPAYLKDLGYHTHMVGKWHLGNCNETATPIGNGFDTHFGSWANHDNRFNQTNLGIFDWNWNNKPYWKGQGTYTTHLITNHTQHMLRTHFERNTTKDEPIFLYTAFLVPHKPAETLESYIANTKCNQIPEYVTERKKNVTNNHRKYCGMVAAMDEGIGNITQTLRDIGVIDDFIIIFSVDNGGAIKAGANNYPLRGSKQTIYEGGTRSRALLRAPGYLKEGHKTGEYDGLIHITDWLPTLLTAARGNSSVLPGDLDGRDSWREITEGMATERQWMVYNIDSTRKLGAIRFKNSTHNFKLIFSNDTKREPGFEYPDPRPKSEQDEYQKKRYKRNGQAYFLYDLSTNKREVPASKNVPGYPDAAESNPEIFTLMKEKLLEEFDKEVDVIKYNSIGNKRTEGGAYVVNGC